MTRWYAAGWIVVAAVVALLLGSAMHYERQAGYLDAQLDASQHRIALLQDSLARTITRVTHVSDTVRVAVVRNRLLRDTVLAHITDTVIVKQYVAQTDTLRSECEALRNACLVLGAVADSTIGAYQTRVKLLERRQPTFMERHWRAAALLGAAGGFYLASKVQRP